MQGYNTYTGLDLWSETGTRLMKIDLQQLTADIAALKQGWRARQTEWVGYRLEALQASQEQLRD